MLTIPRKVIIDKIIDKINDSAIYKKLGVTKRHKSCSSKLRITITLRKTHTMDFIITTFTHKPVTSLAPLYLSACIARVA
jgi:protoporphyrinogen oxidase